MDPKPFHIEVPENLINDLHRRLDYALWPNEVSGAGWELGTDSGYLKELARYWRQDFDWRAAESELNKLSHYTVNIKGLNIHFVHEKGRGPNPTPLLISHGWPSSFFEMHKIIPLLTDPASHGGDPNDSFDVIIPSLPGFVFSETAPEGGMNLTRIAGIFNELMSRLGYGHYGTHGGDVGAGVSAALALRHAEHSIGTHVTSVALVSPWMDETNSPLTQAEAAYVKGRQEWMTSEGAYYMIQSTKPQTVSFGLTDSPIGLAAWIIEKFRAWSDCKGNIENKFTKDELLTNIALYWFTRSIGTANRFYYENRKSPLALQKGELIRGRTGLSVFPADISLPPREWAERTFDLQHYSRMQRGGHFSALEEPELLVEEIRAVFRPNE